MDRTYRIIEIVGVSETSFADAVRNGVSKAAETRPGLAWFETTEMRGLIEAGRVVEFQVGLKIGFREREDGKAGAGRDRRRAGRGRRR